MKIKLCIDCRWYLPNVDDPELSKCGHKMAKRRDAGSGLSIWLVTGRGPQPPLEQHYLCSIQRQSECSIDGKQWEPKEGATVLAEQPEPEIGGGK